MGPNKCVVFFLSVHTAKESISERKRQPSEWGKKSCKWRYPQRIYAQHIQTTCTAQYKKKSNKKLANDLTAHFSKDAIEMAIKHKKRCWTSLVLRERETKCTMGYHLTLTRTAISKTEINPAEGVERKEPSYSVAAAAAKSLQSCPTLCDPRDGSPPGSPVPGILQARTLEWVAISFSNAW